MPLKHKKLNKEVYTTTEIDDKFAPVADALTSSDVVDNLTSSDTDKPLSANQGKELKAIIDALPPGGGGAGIGPGAMPVFWIDDATGHLWYKGEAGMFRINAAGHLEYVFTAEAGV